MSSDKKPPLFLMGRYIFYIFPVIAVYAWLTKCSVYGLYIINVGFRHFKYCEEDGCR